MLAAPSLPVSAPPPVAARAFGLGDARIGMDLAAFQARPGVSCGPGRTAAITLCRGPDLVLGAGYAARDLTYRFLGGRLAQIRFRASIDAFSWVTARLKADDGQPSVIKRDIAVFGQYSRPHVLMTWKNGRSTIALSDPVEPAELSVSITRDAAAAQLPQGQS